MLHNFGEEERIYGKEREWKDRVSSTSQEWKVWSTVRPSCPMGCPGKGCAFLTVSFELELVSKARVIRHDVVWLCEILVSHPVSLFSKLHRVKAESNIDVEGTAIGRNFIPHCDLVEAWHLMTLDSSGTGLRGSFQLARPSTKD